MLLFIALTATDLANQIAACDEDSDEVYVMAPDNGEIGFAINQIMHFAGFRPIYDVFDNAGNVVMKFAAT